MANTDISAEMKTRLCKKHILDELNRYKQSRFGCFSFVFRNHALTKEKIQLADNIIDFVQSFEGSKDELVAGLQNFVAQNCQLSMKYNKFHYNLDGKNIEPVTIYGYDDWGRKWTTIEDRPNVKPGQSSRMSYLADTLHSLIEYLNKRNQLTFSKS